MDEVPRTRWSAGMLVMLPFFFLSNIQKKKKMKERELATGQSILGLLCKMAPTQGGRGFEPDMYLASSDFVCPLRRKTRRKEVEANVHNSSPTLCPTRSDRTGRSNARPKCSLLLFLCSYPYVYFVSYPSRRYINIFFLYILFCIARFGSHFVQF